MNYPDFLSQLANTAEYATDDADFLVMARQALDYAELRLLRDLDPIIFREHRDLPLTVSAGGVLGLPADAVFVRDVWYVSPAGDYALLERRGPEFLLMYTPVPGTFGVPRYWASEDMATLTIAPLAPEDTVLRVGLTYRPVGMSEANPVTWLGTWVPDALFHAAMIFATGFQRSFGEQAGMGTSWEASYQTALAGAVVEMRRRKADGPWDNSREPPVATNAPPG